ncbi:MAG: rhomboid family intramembrane serine protease [Chloroflexi bacterium]|nr:rhomboid family intramembrane serine protease [Chloroflexota bacterium]MDA1226625.1 rhomboid family intramembrane serine protease [Chloroflexota bacterium]
MSIVLLMGFVTLIWVVEILDGFTGNSLDQYGIVPRNIHGLVGIPLSPFLHGGLGHVLSNTLPLLVLGGLVALRGRAILVGLTLFVTFLGGLGIWVIGRPGVHIGASILVFGFFGYLVARGWYDRSVLSFVIAVVVLIFYGGLIFGALPSQGFVSWEGHLTGMLAGIFYARITRKRRLPAQDSAKEP